MSTGLRDRLSSTAFAFRGYNVTNSGRSADLLAHDRYHEVVSYHLKEGSRIYADVVGEPLDLIERVRQRTPSTPDSYREDLVTIVAMELAQITLLRQFFVIEYTEAKMALGYSLGEVTALVAGGVLDLESALSPILSLAKDAEELGKEVQMGILFSRGAALDMHAIKKFCVEVTSTGKGVLTISSILSPNTVLLLGQGETINYAKEHIGEVLHDRVHLKKNPHRWPPLHTLITRQRNMADRASVLLEVTPGGMQAPIPPIFSCVTGTDSYNDYNCRELMTRWVDSPQMLWDVVDHMLGAGVETIIHVGPEPNIIPATFARLSNNVTTQLNTSSLTSLGLRAISRIVRRSRPWLSRLLSKDAALLRAPFIEHVMLEDWLLEQEF